VLIVPEKVGQPGGPLEDLIRARPDDIAGTAEPMGIEVVVLTPEATPTEA
jgi:hypothetical protein